MPETGRSASLEALRPVSFFFTIMTLAELQALSDDQFIEKVAVEVMNWEPRDCFGETLFISSNDTIRPFKPLTDWNHTMEVVMQMEHQGFQFWMTTFHSDLGNRFCTKVIFAKADEAPFEHEDRQRAICLAALLAFSPPQP